MWSYFLAGSLILYILMEIILIHYIRGARSLQSCLGGGDIDGDEYSIIINVCFFGFLFALSLTGALAEPAPSPYCDARRLYTS